jgi:hypothetical protein
VSDTMVYWLDIRRGRIDTLIDQSDRSFTTIIKCNMKVENPSASFVWHPQQRGIVSILSIQLPGPVLLLEGVADIEYSGYPAESDPPEVVSFLLNGAQTAYSAVTIEDGTGTRRGAGRRELLCFKLEDVILLREVKVFTRTRESASGLVLNEFALQMVSPMVSAHPQ